LLCFLKPILVNRFGPEISKNFEKPEGEPAPASERSRTH